ncbi:hypothetical protein [Pseudobacteriovorax antillogorgiicola]|uniref:Porin n=1 Tax=Pseudobacteriovorax antillogorgiicola TaxID=1513793 RepID=A0A1Y6CH13_9BACT|nr:hypothetical protein [Pseudobacteriovorax antillogorgiicola]TCS48721.1 hypothetical protein EDD56_117143 [Pseudobacteriovorax antillogorgiicola]SMF54550.1 hypothetical protein SAMN06296036_11716 [Pseudobacteriovorax antillogorgiicola]
MKYLAVALLCLHTQMLMATEFSFFGRSTGGLTQSTYEPETGKKESYIRVFPDSWFAQSIGTKFVINEAVKGVFELTVYRDTDSGTSEPLVKNFYFDIKLGDGLLRLGTQPTLHTEVAFYHDIIVGGHDGFRPWIAGPAYSGQLNAITFKYPVSILTLGLSFVEAKSPGDADAVTTDDGSGNTEITTPRQTDTPAIEALIAASGEIGSLKIHGSIAYHHEKLGIEVATDPQSPSQLEEASVLTAATGLSYMGAYLGATYSDGDPLVYWFGRRMFAFSATESNIKIREGLKDRYTAYALQLSYSWDPISIEIYNGKETGEVDGANSDIGETTGVQFKYPWQGITWFLSNVTTKLQIQEQDYVTATTNMMGMDVKF